MLKQYLEKGRVEAGCDEAGRGCLAGPVVAAAVILPPDFSNDLLNDSKQLTAKQRASLRTIIEAEAAAWAVAFISTQRSTVQHSPSIDNGNAQSRGETCNQATIPACRRQPFQALPRHSTPVHRERRCKNDVDSSSIYIGQDPSRRIHGNNSQGVSGIRLGPQ